MSIVPQYGVEPVGARVAFSVGTGNHIDDRFFWSAYQTRKPPTRLLRSGLRFCAFDLTKRQITALLEVTHGGSFEYRSENEFEKQVRELTGRPPSREDPHWRSVGEKLRKRRSKNPGAPCFGVAIRWRVLKRDLSLPCRGNSDRTGWTLLLGGDAGEKGTPRVRGTKAGKRDRNTFIETDPSTGRQMTVHVRAKEYDAMRCHDSGVVRPLSDLLRERGWTVGAQKLSNFATDLVAHSPDKKTVLLVEAKTNEPRKARNAIRYAIGQLYEYSATLLPVWKSKHRVSGAKHLKVIILSHPPEKLLIKIVEGIEGFGILWLLRGGKLDGGSRTRAAIPSLFR